MGETEITNHIREEEIYMDENSEEGKVLAEGKPSLCVMLTRRIKRV